ncbi:MAG: MauE/DoxX family redox-associated membrane protein [Bacteroidota bacterium]|jgi:uncharacterized membrane protein YphA (DoxX/SURF4 family)
MNNILRSRPVVIVSRLVLGIVFIVASIDKIAHPEVFADAVAGYQVLPEVLVNIFALAIPWLELVCGVFLVGGVFIRSGSAWLSVMLTVFVVAMLSAMARHLKIDCGCFGAAHASEVGWARIWEDAGLLVLGIHLFFFGEPDFSRVGGGQPPPGASPLQ